MAERKYWLRESKSLVQGNQVAGSEKPSYRCRETMLLVQGNQVTGSGKLSHWCRESNQSNSL